MLKAILKFKKKRAINLLAFVNEYMVVYIHYTWNLFFKKLYSY